MINEQCELIKSKKNERFYKNLAFFICIAAQGQVYRLQKGVGEGRL